MIQFNNLNQEIPYLLFKSKYDEALDKGQKGIEAISISSYNTKMHEVDSRYVNLKFITNDEFIFFSNYVSPKASSFNSHDQIAVLVYWASINVQIRIKAKIKKTSNEYNQKYFFDRSEEKNALAISSNQSKPINSYSQVKENYNKSLENDDLGTRIAKTLINEIVKLKREHIWDYYHIIEQHPQQDHHLQKWIQIILKSLQQNLGSETNASKISTIQNMDQINQPQDKDEGRGQSRMYLEFEIKKIVSDLKERNRYTNAIQRLDKFLKSNPSYDYKKHLVK